MLRITKRTPLLAASLLTLVMMSPHTLAHKSHDHSLATGVVKERLDFMGNMGKAMGGLMAVMRGKKEFNAEDVMAKVNIILEQSGDALTDLFPEGSNANPSEALSNIWSDWDRFVKVSGAMGTKAASLKQAIQEAGDDEAAQKTAFQSNMKNLGSGCRDCHSDYRKKQKKN